MKSRNASLFKRPFFSALILSLALIFAFAHPCLAVRIIDENFEGAGYEEAWIVDETTVSPGCTLNEDAGIPGTPPAGAGSQCLQSAVLDATPDQAYAYQDKTNQNVSYVRGYLYLDEEGFENTKGFFTLALYDNLRNVVARVWVGQQNLYGLVMAFQYYSGGLQVPMHPVFPEEVLYHMISLQRWYRVEYQYNIAASSWAWKVDGETLASGSLSAGNTRTPKTLVIGIFNHNGPSNTTLYTDLVAWDTYEWPGTEPTGPTDHYVDRDEGNDNNQPYPEEKPALTVQAAIDYCDDHAGVGTVYVNKAGSDYGNITMEDNIDVVGRDTDGAAALALDYSDYPIIGSVGFRGSNCTLEGFQIEGTGVSGVKIPSGMGDNWVINATIKNCKIYGAPAGIHINGHTAVTIEGCDITGTQTSGIVSQGQELYPTGYPIVIKNNVIHDLNFGGIVLLGDISDNGGFDITIQGNEIYTADYAGIRLDTLGNNCDITIDNNVIHSNGWENAFKPENKSGAGIYINNVSSATITQNTIYDNNMAGVCIEGDSDITIGADLAASDPFAHGNDIYRNYAGVHTGCRSGMAVNGNLVIRGNRIYNNGGGSEGGGIRFGSPVRTATISQNEIAQNQLGGIGIERAHPTVDVKLVIEKNDIHDNMLRGGIHTGDKWGSFAYPGNFTADSAIRQNKVHHHRNANYGGGIDVRHFKGTVNNNLVYRNNRGGIRCGDNAAIRNNTVVNNGNSIQERGGGIIFDVMGGTINAPPSGDPSESFPLRNNISAYNERAGIRACFYETEDIYGDKYRDHNLLYSNNQDFLSDFCGPCASPDCSTGDIRDKRKCRGAQLGAGCDGQTISCCSAIGATGALPGETLIFADPLFQDMANDDYHLKGGSPAIGSGELGVDMGAYGGPDAMDDNDFPSFSYVDCLIDGDTTTGNAPPGGTTLYFDLGNSYMVRHVRLYGSAATYSWNVYVADTSQGCSGTQVLAGWSVGGASQWYEGDVTDTQASYIGILSSESVDESSIFEFQFTTTATPGPGDWLTPVSVVRDCSDIGGICKQP